MQVKGRLFRTKTLILEEPVFQHDAEQQFGEVLARWQEGGEVGVGSAALTLKVAEQRLLYTAARWVSPTHNTLTLWHAPWCCMH